MNDCRIIFKDEALQKHFEEEGFVTIPLLNATQVDFLRKIYEEEVNIELTTDLNETSRQLGYEKNREISDTIKRELDKGTHQYLKNHTIPGGTFFIKKAEALSEVPIHQDWNIVDEKKHTSALIWCPLLDVNSENGAIIVIPGSHKYFNNFRSGSIHPPRFPSAEFKEKGLGHALKTINLKAGEAIIYQCNLYHGSHPNTTKENRLNIAGTLLSKAANLLYFHQESLTDSVQVIDGENDFFLKYIGDLANGRLPKEAKILKTIPARSFYPTSQDIIRKTEKAFPIKKKSFLKQLFRNSNN